MWQQSVRRIVNRLNKKRNLHNFEHLKYVHNLLDVHPTVRRALAEQRPVVALESTIVTHGMPYPVNFETALEVEAVVKAEGAIPATIACVAGRLKVGLTADELHILSKADKSEVHKCSRRDLPYVIAKSKHGGTTVAATMLIAHMAGIRIFATGGVGGVHRDGHLSLDVSADLIELGRTPVVVVSSGVKSILDVPRTLEYLETQGVCVAAFDNDGIFPDFYTRDSGLSVPYNLANAKEAAKVVNALAELQLKSGMLIAVPVPKENAVEKDAIKAAIDKAHQEAVSRGITGKNVTPFMLAEIAKVTKGTSLKANISLIKNNAKVAAQIARETCKLPCKTNDTATRSRSANLTPIVFGASMLDICHTQINSDLLAPTGATYKTKVKESAGGVGRNLAEGIYKLHGAVDFVSVVGSDHIGKSLLQMMPEDMCKDIHLVEEEATSICSVVLDRCGNCKLCLANMEIHNMISPALANAYENQIKSSALVVIDSNLSVDTMNTILRLASKYKKPVFFEPTDMLIAGKPFESSYSQSIRFISPNICELQTIVETLTGIKPPLVHAEKEATQSCADVNECLQSIKQIEHLFDCIIVTMGSLGVLVHSRGDTVNHRYFDGKLSLYRVPDTQCFTSKFYSAPKVSNITNVSGAGDSFSSGFITGVLRGFDLEESVALGFIAAQRALQSQAAVPSVYFQNHEEENTLLKQQLSLMQQAVTTRDIASGREKDAGRLKQN